MNRANGWIRALGLVAMFAFVQSAWAVTCTSVATTQTDWNKSKAWDAACGGQPPVGATVVIASGTNILADASTNVVGNITINAGGTLTGLAGNTISLSGSLTNNGGMFTAGGAAVSFVGTTAQTISGTFTFADLILTNLAGVTISGNVTITGNFTPGLSPITVAAGSTLTVNGKTYSGPCTASYTIVATFCGGGTPVPVLGAFDAFEMGGTVNGPIKTHVEGRLFKLDVVAIKAGAIDTAYTRKITVGLVDASAAGFNCATALPIPATISPPANTNMISGKTTYAFAVQNAYKNLQVKVTDRNAVVTCPNDHFAVRPDKFTAPVVSDTDWVTQGARVLNNLDANVSGVNAGKSGCQSGTTPVGCVGAIHKAGQPFLVTATAVDGAVTAAPAVLYGDVPDAVICVGAACSPANNRVGTANMLLATATVLAPAACTGTACIGTPGAMALAVATPATAVTVGGVVTADASVYGEVGAFTLQLQDQMFADIDKNDTLGDCSVTGRYICSDPVDVGRFVPDHFDTVVTDGIPCPVGMTCTPASGFTYSGQTFAVQVTAMNGLATPGKTSNYAKAVTLADANAAVTPVGVLAPVTIAATVFATGIATAAPGYTFNVSKTAPTVIKMRAGDADVSTAGVNEGTTEIRSGRIKISNAYGSELLALPMTAAVQYYNGGSWVVSATDNATSFNTNLFAAGGNVNTSIVTGPLANVSVQNANANMVVKGAKVITLAKPGKAGSVDISLSAPGYLLAGSNGASVNPSLPGRATFSVYKGNHTFVYLREAY